MRQYQSAAVGELRHRGGQRTHCFFGFFGKKVRITIWFYLHVTVIHLLHDKRSVLPTNGKNPSHP